MLNFLVAKKTLLERDLPPPKWFGVYTLRDGNGFTLSLCLLPSADTSKQGVVRWVQMGLLSICDRYHGFGQGGVAKSRFRGCLRS